MLTPELVQFVQSGLTTIVGSSGADKQPHCMRGVGLVAHDGGRTVSVFLPCVAAGCTLQDLSGSRRIATTLGEIGTHRAIQLKGTVRAIALANNADRSDMDRLLELTLSRLTFVGFPRAIIENVNRWPSWRVDFDIEGVFVQTPGPLAGKRLGGDVVWR